MDIKRIDALNNLHRNDKTDNQAGAQDHWLIAKGLALMLEKIQKTLGMDADLSNETNAAKALEIIKGVLTRPDQEQPYHSNPFRKMANGISSDEMAADIMDHLADCQKINPNAEINSLVIADVYVERLADIANSAALDAENNKDDKDLEKKAENAKAMSENAKDNQDDFEKSPQFYDIVIEVLENKDRNLTQTTYDWACDELASAQLSYRVYESATKDKQEITLVADFGNGKKFEKIVDFAQQRNDIRSPDPYYLGQTPVVKNRKPDMVDKMPQTETVDQTASTGINDKKDRQESPNPTPATVADLSENITADPTTLFEKIKGILHYEEEIKNHASPDDVINTNNRLDFTTALKILIDTPGLAKKDKQFEIPKE